MRLLVVLVLLMAVRYPVTATELHRAKPVSVEGGASPVEHFAMENLIHSVLPNSRQFLDALLLEDTTNPDATAAFNDMVGVSKLLETSADMADVMYCGYGSAILPMEEGVAQQTLTKYIHEHVVDLMHGIIPTSLTSVEETLLVDPIPTGPSVRRVDPNVIYLFPTMAQQMFVFGFYIHHLLPRPDIHAAIRSNSSDEHNAILLAFHSAMEQFGLTPQTLQSFSDTVESVLQPTGINIIVGLSGADVIPLVTFLRNNAEAVVLVNFDELTLLYNALINAFGGSYDPAMDRVQYATNLPNWQFAPSSKHSTLLSLFFEDVPAALRTPAGLRTFLSIFWIDYLAYHFPENNFTRHARKAIYRNEVFHLDGTIRFGPFLDYCLYPSTDQLRCLVNYGADGLRMWSLRSAFIRRTQPLTGVVAPHLTEDENHRILLINDSSYNNMFMLFVILQLPLHIMVMLALLYFGHIGYFEPDSVLVTAVYVRVHRQQPGPAHLEEMEQVMEQLSEEAAVLMEKYGCVEIEATQHGFTAVTCRARAAQHFALDLQKRYLTILGKRSLRSFVQFSMGIHSGWCSAYNAFDTGHVSEIALVSSSVAVMARCVGEVTGPGQVMMTQWTYDALMGEGGRELCTLSHTGSYHLDEEAAVVQLYQVVGEPWCQQPPHLSSTEAVLVEQSSTDPNPLSMDFTADLSIFSYVSSASEVISWHYSQ